MKKEYIKENYSAILCHGSMEFKEVLTVLHKKRFKWNNGKPLLTKVNGEYVLGEINPLKLFNNSVVLKLNDSTIQYTTTNWCKIRKIVYKSATEFLEDYYKEKDGKEDEV